jgi:predicted nicotinamide N-methyase
MITGVRDGTITLRVSQNVLEGNTGCHQWEAGLFLAEHVLNHPELVKGEDLPMLARSAIHH